MDPRTALTKANIKRAFLQLSEETPLDQISVSTLCKKVGIPRQTFYYHYDSWQQLIEDILDDEAIAYFDIFKNAGDDLMDAVRKQLEAMEEHRGFHLRLEEAGYDSLLVKKVAKCSYDAFAEKWLSGVSTDREREAKMNFTFAIAGFYHLILNRENEYDKEEIIEFVVKYLRFQRDMLKK